MNKCGHCDEEFIGVEDHIKAKHGFPFACLGPTLDTHYGKNSPPEFQTDSWPDKQMVCQSCGSKYTPEYDENHDIVLWPEEDCCNMCIGKL